MVLLIAVHFGLAAVTPLLGRWLRQRAFWVLAVPPALTFGWLLLQAPEVGHGGTVVEQVDWIPALGIQLSFALGTLQWLLGLVVSGIGVLVLLYCRWYFAGNMPTRTAAVLLAFAGAMLGLVTADDLILVYVFWELTTVFSYLLVGHNPVNPANRRAAMTALIVTTFGGLAMLVGVLMLGAAAGTYQVSAILAEPPTGAAVTVAVLLVLVGAVSKSALVPFHFWLPGAMAAPTPVSAYLHAAAMVKAGVYLVALLAPGFADTPLWRPVLLVLGPLTMLVGGWRALRQHDIKLLLAYGTVSQLGFMITIVGFGTRSAALAGCALLLAHALFKSALFMIVGVVDHQAGTRDLRRLSGVGRQRPALAVTAVLAAASMAGIPPTLGFVAKEGALAALLEPVSRPVAGLPSAAAAVVLAAVVAGSVLTVAYTLRFLWGAFATKRPAREDLPAGEPAAVTPCARPAAGFWLTAAVPAGLGLLLGLVPAQLSHRLEPYAESLPAGAHGELVLWHGVTVPLGLSVLAILLGIGLFLFREPVAVLQAGLPRMPDTESGYGRLMRAVDRVAVEITALAQRGSLPYYLGTIALVLVLFPGWSLVQAGFRVDRIAWFDNPAQPVVGALVIAAAVLAGRARGRVKAILLVGVTGYGTAFLFLLHGAPDLALTQVLVETVTLVVLALVLRRLGPYFSDRPLLRSRWWRLVLAVGAGAVASAAALLALGHRTAVPVSVAYDEEAYRFGYGKNIVNVTLVDTRAWDTLGEISVLMVAATGVASLIFVVTRSPRLHRAASEQLPGGRVERPAAGPGGTDGVRLTWLRGQRSLSPFSRSIVFAVMVRLLFPIMILCSLYLLFTGHNAPGGGFAAGLITGLAIMVRYLAGGSAELAEAAPVDAGRVLGAGLLVSTLSAVAPTLFGGRILQSYAIDLHLGALSRLHTAWGEVDILGDVHLVTSLFFDVGVYLVVVGVLLDLVRSLGAGVDLTASGRPAPATTAAATGAAATGAEATGGAGR